MAEKGATPDAANRLLGMLSILMEIAIAQGWRDDNPAFGVKRLNHHGTGFATWAETDIAVYRNYYTLGTRSWPWGRRRGAVTLCASAGGTSPMARSWSSRTKPAPRSRSLLSASFTPRSTFVLGTG
jgi:hypothetical protein